MKSAQTHSEAQSPNIIFVIADDVGYGDPSCYNPESKIPTPHMDRIAREGMRFTDAHSAASVCTPSRYGVLTGRYCWRTALPHGALYNYEPPLIEPTRLTMASMLHSLGYATACVGKWHLGLNYRTKPGEFADFQRPLPWGFGERFPEQKIDFHQALTGGPIDLGFDYFFGTSGISTQCPPYGFIENDHFIEPPCIELDPPRTGSPTNANPGMMSPGWDPKEVDPTFAQHAVYFIEQQANSDRPFFLYLASSAPHEPCIETFTPEFARGRSKAGPRGDLVWLYDWMVGQVLDALDRSSQAENTLIVVTSDHGALIGDCTVENGQQIWHTYGHKSCGDWRGQKCQIWEGGHRIPLLARWPGRIPAGQVSEELVGLTDLMATWAAMLNICLPEHTAEDSVNILPILTGKPHDRPIRNSIVHHSQMGVFAIRRGAWKLILDSLGSGGWPPPIGTMPEPGTPGQLYNLQDDAQESTNLWQSQPDIVSELTQLLDEQKRYGRTVPHRSLT